MSEELKGWVLVPREPTGAMQAAGQSAKGPLSAWSAMIAAAPSSPEHVGGGSSRGSGNDLCADGAPDPVLTADPVSPRWWEVADRETVWRVCHSRRKAGGKTCERCPSSELADCESFTRGCYLQAVETVNIVQTGNPWRKTEGVKSPWIAYERDAEGAYYGWRNACPDVRRSTPEAKHGFLAGFAAASSPLTERRPIHYGALVSAAQQMLDDYQTSEAHHPHHVLVPLEAFNAMRVALDAARAEGGAASDLAAGTHQPVAQQPRAENKSPEHAGDVEGLDLAELVDRVRGSKAVVNLIAAGEATAPNLSAFVVCDNLDAAADALEHQARLLEERTRERDEWRGFAACETDAVRTYREVAKDYRARAEAAERLLEEVAGALEPFAGHADYFTDQPPVVWVEMLPFVGSDGIRRWLTPEHYARAREALSKVRVGGDFSASQASPTEEPR